MRGWILGMGLFILTVLWQADVSQQPGDPDLLTWDELVQLYEHDTPPPVLQEKLDHLLTTPFVRNTAYESAPRTGKILRVVQWNIERGLEFDAIRYAFTDSQRFERLMEEKGSTADRGERDKILEELRILQ